MQACHEAQKRARAPGVAPAVRGIRLAEMLRCFETVLLAQGSGAVPDVYMGLMEGHSGSIELHLGEGPQGGSPVQIAYHLEQMVTVLQFTRRNENSGTKEPIEVIEKQIARTISQIFESVSYHRLPLISKSAYMASLEPIVRPVFQTSRPIVQSLVKSRHLADQEKYEAQFLIAVQYYEQADFKTTKNLLEDCLSGLECATERESRLSPGQKDLSIRLQEYYLYIAICSGYQYMTDGDRLLDRALSGADGSPDEFAQAALLAQDSYRHALNTVVEKDIEAEIQALCKIAHLYRKILLIPTRANTYYLRAVQMAASLTPALPTGKWYEKARDVVERDVAKFTSLASTLADLELAAKKKNRDFILLLSSDNRFKSRVNSSDLKLEPAPDETDDNKDRSVSRQIMLKVIARYHPDKNIQWRPTANDPLDPQNADTRYAVLCEEISKILTTKYSVFAKGEAPA